MIGNYPNTITFQQGQIQFGSVSSVIGPRSSDFETFPHEIPIKTHNKTVFLKTVKHIEF